MENEKKVYETPEVTKVEFDASDRITASTCTTSDLGSGIGVFRLTAVNINCNESTLTERRKPKWRTKRRSTRHPRSPRWSSMPATASRRVVVPLANWDMIICGILILIDAWQC